MAIAKLGFNFKCDHPHCTTEATYAGNILTAIDKARADGWAVTKSRRGCWCKQHADMHRNLGSICACN